MFRTQFTTFCPDGRYRKMTTPEQHLPWQACHQGLIEPLGLRLYCVLHEMAERRRYTPSRPAHFAIPECCKLLGSARRSPVEKALERLCTSGLVDWSPSALRFATQPTAVPGIDLSGYIALRASVHPQRVWVPLARRMLRYLGRCGSPGQIATVFYVSQHSYWDAANGVCAGAVSPAAIAACYGFSKRTAARHLDTLEALGWFTVEPRPRWYERQYGRWCVLNARWEAPRHPPSLARPLRPRRPVQLLLPLLGDTARVEASPHPAPAMAVSSETQEGGSSSPREACPSESIDADPAPCAQVTPEDRCERLSSCEGTACKILSHSIPNTPSNDAGSLGSPSHIPLQELEHQTPTAQADSTPPTVPPTKPTLASSPAATGVCHDEQKKPEASTRPSDIDALEAVYAGLPPEAQATLRAQAEAVLIQRGTKRDFLVWPAILSTIGGLLEAQAAGEAVGSLVPTRATIPLSPRTSNLSGTQVETPPARAQPCLATRWPPVPASGVDPRRDRKPKKGKLPAPTLEHILIADLQEISRLLVLLDQARKQELIGDASADRLTFAAMAVHALRVGVENPCGLFRTLLHDPQLRIVLSDADDEAARVLLNAHEYGIDPQRRAPPPREASEPPPLSDDARFVDLARRVLGQDGWHGDPFIAVKIEYPEWTRARWDQAASELEQPQRVPQTTQLAPIEELLLGEDWWPSRGPSEAASCAECGEGGPACACRDVEDIEDG